MWLAITMNRHTMRIWHTVTSCMPMITTNMPPSITRSTIQSTILSTHITANTSKYKTCFGRFFVGPSETSFNMTDLAIA